MIVAYDKSDSVKFAMEREARDNALKAAEKIGGVTGLAVEMMAKRAAERWKQSRKDPTEVPTFDVSKFVSGTSICHGTSALPYSET